MPSPPNKSTKSPPKLKLKAEQGLEETKSKAIESFPRIENFNKYEVVKVQPEEAGDKPKREVSTIIPSKDKKKHKT